MSGQDSRFRVTQRLQEIGTNAPAIVPAEGSTVELVPMVTQCCVCYAILRPQGDRQRQEDWIAFTEMLPVSHGYCPGCLEGAMNDMRATAPSLPG